MLFTPDGKQYVPPVEPEYVEKALDIGPGNGANTIEAIVGASNTSTDREVYWQQYVRHPWVRTCVDIIAETIASEGYLLQKVDGENAQSYDADKDSRVLAVHQFFRAAFPKSTLRQQLLLLAIDNCVYGVGYWRKKRARKLIVGLERLDPRSVTRKKDLSAYILRAPGATIAEDQIIPAEDVIAIGNGIGDAREGGLSPLEALDMTLATDMFIRRHRNAFFSNNATAGSVLVNKSADKKQVEAAERSFSDTKTGSKNAYRPLVLTGDWAVEHLGQSGDNEVDFVKASGISREEVLMVYRVPPGKIFVNDGALGSAGKSQDDTTFQQNAVLPLEERIYEMLTVDLLQGEFKIPDLEMVPKRRAALRYDMFSAAEALVKFGGTGNEARSLVNLQPSKEEGMDDPLFITSRQPIAQEDIESTSEAQPTDAVPEIKPEPKKAKR